MTRYFGVICKTDETKIALGRIGGIGANEMEFHAVPLDPVPCSACGSNHLYGSDDLVEFEAEDDIPLVP